MSEKGRNTLNFKLNLGCEILLGVVKIAVREKTITEKSWYAK